MWHLWIGTAQQPGPGSQDFVVDVFNVGGWLSHGDFALEVDVDFLAVVNHRLIPAGVRSEWSRLRAEGLASIWALASQESSHVGVRAVSMQGAPVALPARATAQLQRFFDCGRAVGYLLPSGESRSTHLVVLVIKVLIVMLSSLRCCFWRAWCCCSWAALLDSWYFQRGAHQDSLSA